MALSDILDRSDDAVDVTIGGQDVSVEIIAPGHMEIARLSELEAQLSEAYENLKEGQILDREQFREHYDFIDDHILKVEGETWLEETEADRKEFFRRISGTDFWKLFNGICDAGTLRERQKKASKSSSSESASTSPATASDAEGTEPDDASTTSPEEK